MFFGESYYSLTSVIYIATGNDSLFWIKTPLCMVLILFAICVVADTEKEGSWAEMYCQNALCWWTRPLV